MSCAQHLVLVPRMALPPEGLPSSPGRGTVQFIPSAAGECGQHHPCSWQELNSEMRQHQEDLATLEHLAEELSSCGFAPPSAFQQQEKLQSLKKDFLQLQKVAKDR